MVNATSPKHLRNVVERPALEFLEVRTLYQHPGFSSHEFARLQSTSRTRDKNSSGVAETI